MTRVIRHGTANEYGNYRCRCADCRAAWAAYMREKIKGTCPECGGRLSNRYVSKICRACSIKLREPDHGTEGRYNHRSCRCDACREASARARRLRRQRATAA